MPNEDISPLFMQTYANIILDIREDRYSCIKEFIKGLKDEFGAKQSGLLWPDNSGKWSGIITIPKEQNLGEWLDNENFQKKLAENNELPYRWLYDQKNHMRQDEQDLCTYENVFIGLKVPRLYDEYFGKNTCYICLIGPLYISPPYIEPVKLILDLLANLVDVWGWRKRYHGYVLDMACSTLAKEEINENNQEGTNLKTSIEKCVRCIGGMLRTRQLFQTGLVYSEKFSEDEKTTIPSCITEILSNWHHCSPPFWPPCKGEKDFQDKDRLVEILKIVIEWTKYSNIDRLKDGSIKIQYDEQIGYMKLLGDQSRNIIVKSDDNKGNNHIQFSRKSLLQYFYHHAMQKNDIWGDFWFSKKSSFAYQVGVFLHLNQLTQYLLADFPFSNKTIQGIIWLLSEYAHHVLKLPDRIDFQLHLLQAARGEPALHSLKHYYRDHFFHALEVCFLGHFLLELEISNDQPLWEKIAIKLRCPEDKTRVLRLWYLAALLHDVGYGIDALKGVRTLLGFFKNAKPLEGLGEDVEKAVERLSEELSDHRFVGYEAEDKPGEDHGVIGAQHLQGLLESIAKDDKEVKVEEYKPAIRAIALHSHRKHRVKFNDDPLAFLLILCDTIQEWNRLQMNFATAPADILGRLQNCGVREEDLMGPLKKVVINSNYNDKDNVFKLSDSKLRISLEYNEGISKNAGVFDLWLDASCNFQRLDFTGLDGLDIEVEYVTPLYRTTEQQFYRLRDAARETHMGFLEKWFPTEQKQKTDNGESVSYITNEAVEYYPPVGGGNGQGGKEKLVLNLRKLCEKKRITKDIDEFRKRLTKWKDYNDDRDFSGDYADIIPE